MGGGCRFVMASLPRFIPTSRPVSLNHFGVATPKRRSAATSSRHGGGSGTETRSGLSIINFVKSRWFDCTAVCKAEMLHEADEVDDVFSKTEWC